MLIPHLLFSILPYGKALPFPFLSVSLSIILSTVQTHGFRLFQWLITIFIYSDAQKAPDLASESLFKLTPGFSDMPPSFF